MIGSKVSRRYAKALFGIGLEDGRFEQYGRDLRDFSGFCASHPEVFHAISNRIFSVEERKKVMEFLLARSDFGDTVKNFLRILLEKDRIAGIAQVAEYYGRLTDEVSNVMRAEVLTARPIKRDVLERLKAALKKLSSKEVRVTVKEDRSLIGGLVVKIGDMVLDGSVKAQLTGLMGSLKH